MSHKPPKYLFLLFIVFIILFSTGHSKAQNIPNFRIKEEAARESFHKGLSFFNSGQYVAAKEFFYDALNIHPYFHLARRYLGDSYYYSGEWNEALEQWTFLYDLSENAYPLVKNRYELLRFYLNRYRNPGEYVYYKSYDQFTLSNYDISTPVDLFIDHSNLLTILSYKNSSMLQVHPSGEIFGSYSGLPFMRPEGPLAVDIKDDLFYLAEYNADRVGVYRKSGLPVLVFGESGNKDGQFRGPSGIRVTDKSIYVSDSGNNRIQKFDLSGKFIFSITGDGNGASLRYPAGIALDKNGLLYVADRDGKRILVYDQDGNYVEEFKSDLLKKPRNIDPGKRRLWVADEESGILHYSFEEKTWGTLNELDDGQGKNLKYSKPFSIREDRSGILYVSNYISNRVDILTPAGFRTSNLDVKIERVDTGSYPDMAVFLTVKNRTGYPLQGLPKNSFKLYENDRRIGTIRSDNMRPFNTKMNSVFVFEASPDIQNQGTAAIDSTIKPIIQNIRINDKIKVVRCGEQVRNVYEGLHRLEILKSMEQGDVAENPNTGKGLYEGISLLLNEIGPRSIFLIVSGKTNDRAFNQYSKSKIIQYANSHNVNINILSYEMEDSNFLNNEVIDQYREIAELTGGHYLNAYNETEIRTLYDRMRDIKDIRYILTYRALDSDFLKDHYVDVRVEVSYLDTVGISDGGYFVPSEY